MIKMKRIIISAVMLAGLIGLSSCEKNILVIPENYKQVSYYSDEILPDQYSEMYGRWKLVGVSGGFSGGGYEPDFDYLEIRKVGVYGIAVNDSIIEYGRIVIDTFDTQNPEILQIKFEADYHSRYNPYFYPGFYVDVNQNELNLNAHCCDFFHYRFKRITIK